MKRVLFVALICSICLASAACSSERSQDSTATTANQTTLQATTQATKEAAEATVKPTVKQTEKTIEKESATEVVNNESDEWKRIYIDFFKSTEKSDFEEYGFTIADVDDDGIPELFCTPFAVAGTNMAWIKDGEVEMQPIGYGAVKYISSQKLIYCSYINHGVYHDNVFTFNNHELNKVFFGSILPEANGFDNPGWFIGNSHESVTEEEYNEALNESFDMDSSQSIKSGQYVEREMIISAIENY